jgi:hypothetical protein
MIEMGRVPEQAVVKYKVENEKQGNLVHPGSPSRFPVDRLFSIESLQRSALAK